MPEPIPGRAGVTSGSGTTPGTTPGITPIAASDLSYGSGFFLKALLIGPGGSGKTSGAITAPGPILLLDADQGKEVLIGAPGVDIIDIPEPDPKSPNAMRKNIEIKRWIEYELKQGTFPYQTVVYDSVTRLYNMAMNYVKQLDPARGPGGTPVTTHWLSQKKECQDFLEFFIHAPFHFIATVHEAADKDELLGKISINPDITGKDAGWITQRFGEVYRCFSKIEIDKLKGETVTYWWRTQPEAQLLYLKSRMNTRSQFWGPIVEPSFEKLMRLRGVWADRKEGEG